MIVVFGANGKLGREICIHLSDHALTAAVRRPVTDDIFTRHNIPTVCADVLALAQCEQLIATLQPEIVISTVGGKNSQGIRSDDIGNINIIKAVEKYAPTAKMVLVTSLGCGDQWLMMSPMFQRALGEAIQAKTTAEHYLQNSALDWLIVRPSGLTDGEDEAIQLLTHLPEKHSVYVSRKSVARGIGMLLAQGKTKGIYSILSATNA
ncbi:NAD(P)-dependent oxidoreductase [Spirabiliibacterium falconis]|uniref:NAD(P)-dependent oxidoreductase n=1 Tax=Spirabiliibacterium falconis TaxID=572023 RepID=UPI001AACC8B2|nr:NAD(P)-binding oxidoreductase [Spirabiliibacterium falconis]MBE2894833.1 SDR family oxidoreductase [Spirabiliibacterium falconis]